MNRVIQRDKPGDKNKNGAAGTTGAHPNQQQEHPYNSGHLDFPFACSYHMGQGRVSYSEFPVDRHNLSDFQERREVRL